MELGMRAAVVRARVLGAASAAVVFGAAGGASAAGGGIGAVVPAGVGALMAAGMVQPPAEQGEPPREQQAGGRGQQQQPAAEDPLTDPAVERIIGDLERAATPRRPVEPVRPPEAVPARPGVLAGVRPVEREAQRGRLVPEGTFLPSRRGRMTRSDEGEWVFNFDQDTTGLAEPAMVLLPSQTLMAMEGHAMRGGESAVLIVSGQVFVYHGRNYLMPTLFQPARRVGEVVPLQ